MKNIKQKVLMVTTLTISCFLMTISMIGCGGGGGGNGRQILPGENPAGPSINTGTGTGTGSGTGTGTGTGTNTGTLTPAEKIVEGWKSFEYGNYGGAIIFFDQVLTDNTATADERQEAYNGRGWAKSKQYETVSGLSDFQQGGDLLESRLGYAMALIQNGQLSGIDNAITIMEEIGLGNTAYTLALVHQQIGVTSAESHAMLAYAYFWRGTTGDDDKARAQINAARAVDQSETSSVAQIYATLKKAGLTGI